MADTTTIQQVRAWLGTGALNIFGLPFAGKDTQGERLATALGAPFMGGGDILRNSVIPAHVKAIMHQGGLVPIADYLQIVLPYLSHDRHQGQPLVLSSVGRWDGEQAGVEAALEQSHHPLKAVLFLNLDERIIWRRWEASQQAGRRGQRHDDAADALEYRLEEFRVKTRPVIDYYRQRGLLIELDGDQPIEAVEANLWQALAERANLSRASVKP